jgi:hypothetical protein
VKCRTITFAVVCYFILIYYFIKYFYYFQYSPQSTINIAVEEGHYQESSWIIYDNKDMIMKGSSKEQTFVTTGFQNKDHFINCESGI